MLGCDVGGGTSFSLLHNADNESCGYEIAQIQVHIRHANNDFPSPTGAVKNASPRDI